METQLDNRQVEILIEKYFAGETSSKEEKTLLTYFSTKDVSEEWQKYQPYFCSLNELKNKQTRLSISEEKPLFRSKKRYNLSYFVRFAAVAAAVALVVVWFQIQTQPDNYVVINGKKYTDKETVEQVFTTSIQNVKLNTQDIFKELNRINEQ